MRRIVGDIGTAEELAQDALVAAPEQWPTEGVLERPGAWLMGTAKHHAFDVIRRRKTLDRKHEEIGRSVQRAPIFDHGGQAVGAIGVVDSTDRIFPRGLARGLGAAVSEAARGVSRELGAPRWPYAAEA